MSEASLVSWAESAGLFQESRLARIGFPHGVTHRRLGNMKEPTRRDAACRAAGLDPYLLFIGKQVHGAEVREASLSGERKADAECDGWVTQEPGLGVAVFAADCLPIFVWDDKRSMVGAFHAGWRGLAAGMPKAAVAAFAKKGLPASRLAAAVGPHVGACCYSVGEELKPKFHPETLRQQGRRLFLDLGEEARLQLVEAGLKPTQITISSDCTRCKAGEFFSFRREKMDNRMIAFIGLPGGKS